MEWEVILVLFGTFFVFLGLGVPISFAIGVSSLLTVMLQLPFSSFSLSLTLQLIIFSSYFPP